MWVLDTRLKVLVVAGNWIRVMYGPYIFAHQKNDPSKS